ncbi:hypothetical protein Droror1_Dr00020441 [Drosera rotundifolia]
MEGPLPCPGVCAQPPLMSGVKGTSLTGLGEEKGAVATGRGDAMAAGERRRSGGRSTQLMEGPLPGPGVCVRPPLMPDVKGKALVGLGEEKGGVAAGRGDAVTAGERRRSGGR